MIATIQREMVSLRQRLTDEERRKMCVRILAPGSIQPFSLSERHAHFLHSGDRLSIERWDGDLKLRLKDGQTVGYYLSALARGAGEETQTLHLAAFFRADGTISSAFKTLAVVQRSGAFYPTGPHEPVWTKDMCTDEEYPLFFDAVISALDRERSEPGRGR